MPSGKHVQLEHEQNLSAEGLKGLTMFARKVGYHLKISPFRAACILAYHAYAMLAMYKQIAHGDIPETQKARDSLNRELERLYTRLLREKRMGEGR